MKHQIDHAYKDHGFTAGDERFVILAHSAVATDPGESALHDPSFAQHDETDIFVAPLHNIQDPASQGFRPEHELTRVAAIGPNAFQSWVQATALAKHQLGSVSILDIGSMHHQCQDQTQCVDDHMPLAAIDFLARVVTARPPFSVVLTLWLSIMAAEGEAFRPAAKRTFSRRML